MGRFAIGQSVPRTEDDRLTTGRGKFLDDFVLSGECHAIFLRSPHAHARIVSIDASAARTAPGILAVYTGADLAPEKFGSLPPFLQRQRRDGSPMFAPARALLAADTVKLVGEAVAVIIAETRNQARDAAELVSVEYEALPVVVDTERAREPGTPAIWDGCADNETFFFAIGDKPRVDAAFAGADHVTKLRLEFNRVTHCTMEARGCIGDYDYREDRYTLYAGTQRPHATRTHIAKLVMHMPETKLRLVAGEVGGSFGMKNDQFPEYPVCLWASRQLGRPVKWVSDRSEAMLSDDHDRDHISYAALALDRNGRFLAARVSNISNIGAYMNPAGMISASTHFGSLAGTYTTPAIYAEVSAVLTNTGCAGPYRGSGRPEAAYVIERLIDTAAREMGIDAAEIRRRNTVPASAMPFQTGLNYKLDSGNFPANLERALQIADYNGFEARRAEAKRGGMLRGIGLSNVIEQAAMYYGETIQIRFDPSGGCTVIPGSISQGQGHETMYKIIVSDRLGIDADTIRVALSDTDVAPDGGGTYASRTAVLGGTASAMASDKIIEKGKRIAAHILEAAAVDIEFGDGEFRVAGTDRKVSIAEVARVAHIPSQIPKDMETGLADTASFAPEIPTFPNGCHVCELEIDPETGTTRILRYSVVDDVGTVINHLTLEGQIHGGIVQGIGQCFSEHMRYDPDSGQLLTGSFMDYGLPRADDTCDFDMENIPAPTPTNPLGVKGAGEAGNVGALPAIMNAVVDALAPLGVRSIDMPATPEKVWRAIEGARAAA